MVGSANLVSNHRLSPLWFRVPQVAMLTVVDGTETPTLTLPCRCRVWGSCESVLSKTRSMHPDQLMNTVQQEEVEPALAE